MSRTPDAPEERADPLDEWGTQCLVVLQLLRDITRRAGHARSLGANCMTWTPSRSASRSIVCALRALSARGRGGCGPPRARGSSMRWGSFVFEGVARAHRRVLARNWSVSPGARALVVSRR